MCTDDMKVRGGKCHGEETELLGRGAGKGEAGHGGRICWEYIHPYESVRM